MTNNSSPADSQPVPSAGRNSEAKSDDDRLAVHYSNALGSLIDEAVKNGKHRLLIDVLAFHLARFIAAHGAIAAGFILERLGAYSSSLTERQRALEEANAAKRSGQPFN